MLVYLKEFHRDDITNLLNDNNDCLHVSLNVNLTHLKRNRPELYAEVVSNVWITIPKWDKALLEAQKELVEGNCFLEDDYQIKENCHVRFMNLPQFNATLKRSFPGNDQVGQFVKVKGNVVRMTQGRLLEFKREYRCTRCKETYTLEAKYNKMYVLDAPKKCLNPNGLCKGNLQPKNAHPKPEYCMDYQEVRLQELFSDKYIPSSLLVTLENDLVDYCQPGDCVTICGTIEIRWPQISKGKRFEVDISLRAVSVLKDEEKINSGKDLSEQLVWVRAQWQDTIDNIGQLVARDTIVRSICPEIHGMYLVKLAVALALCSGVQCSLSAGANRRGSSHLLLVGEPGLAKSKLLKAASKISVCSVYTTGMGCSAAGLTAAAIKEEGEWQLEAGALVLADGGVCCIDEFNLMSENDKASIHEAMEQQTISMAKAGLVCKLNTRCVVLAATNPKHHHSTLYGQGVNHINIGIGSPLLSRFDVILILRDEHDAGWDNRISDHILQNTNTITTCADIWDLERLQSHFLAVQEIKPELTSEANLILGSYYKYCRSDPMGDSSRTTARLLDSINRLAQAHARLMFRDRVDAVDAVAIIRLMESSWGFGRLLNSIDILRENLPLGPNENQVHEVTTRLGLETLNPAIMKSLEEFGVSNRELRNQSREKQDKSPMIGHLQSLFGFNKDNVKKLPTYPSKSKSSPEKVKQNVIVRITEGSHKENVSVTSESSSQAKSKGPASKRKKDTPLASFVGRKTLFDSPVLDDALDMDIFDSLEMEDQRESKSSPNNSFGQKPSTSKESAATISKKSTNSSTKKAGKNSFSKPADTNTTNLSVTPENALFNSTILDDSLDMDLFNSLDTVVPQKNGNNSQTNTSTVITCPERSQDLPFKPLTFHRTNPLDLNDEDLEDAGLDIDISFTPKTGVSLNHKNENRLISSSPSPESSNSKRQTTTEKSRPIEESTSPNSSPKPGPSKRIRLASQTLDKLNKFVNPNLIEVVINPVEDTVGMEEENKPRGKETEDSAYDTMMIPTLPNRFTEPGQCSSHVLASLDDDLECLNFDL